MLRDNESDENIHRIIEWMRVFEVRDVDDSWSRAAQR